MESKVNLETQQLMQITTKANQLKQAFTHSITTTHTTTSNNSGSKKRIKQGQKIQLTQLTE